ncbi:MAG TPA: hypothetical protein VHD87_14935 [Acidimicrobiales bacterium]|nr:hypothetical protein [Acidimicrobiales bacterium]
MATKRLVIETTTCDVCGAEGKDVTSEVLTLGSEKWSVDLCKKDRAAIAKQIANWTRTARPLGRRRPKALADEEWDYLESVGFTRHTGRKTQAELAALTRRATPAPATPSQPTADTAQPASASTSSENAPIVDPAASPPPADVSTPAQSRTPATATADEEWAYLESLGYTRHRGRKSRDELRALARRSESADPTPRVVADAGIDDACVTGDDGGGEPRRFECEVCGRDERNARRLTSHMKREHGIDDDQSSPSNVVPLTASTGSVSADERAPDTKGDDGAFLLRCDDCDDIAVKPSCLRELALHVQANHRRPLTPAERTPRMKRPVAS